MGAATPHFAFQARDRVAAYAAALPPDHPRQAELAAHLEYLDHLGYEGETAGVTVPDLPPRPSVPGLRGSGLQLDHRGAVGLRARCYGRRRSP